MSTRLLVLRHAQSTWNRDGIWQGLADAPLSVLGEEQARQVAPRLLGLGIDRVVSSHLSRARRTAEILAEVVDLMVAIEPGLCEFDVGEWCGLTRAQIEDRYPGMLEAWRDSRLDRIPGGESRAAFEDRVERAFDAVATEPGTTLVVTHGGVLRAMELRLGLIHEPVPNLSGRWLTRSNAGEWLAGELFLAAENLTA